MKIYKLCVVLLIFLELVQQKLACAQLTTSNTSLASPTGTTIPTTPTRMSDCHNGGICLIYNQTGYCKSCKCPTGYTGSLCKTAPTVIKVDVTYTSLANSSNKSLNKTAIISLVQRVFKEHAKNLTMSVVTSYKLNLVKPSLTIKLLRPPNWYNYTSVTPLENRLRVELQNKASLKLLFGNSKNITLHGLIMDVRECESLWHDCSFHAWCDDIQRGYKCTCDSGYEGDGRTCNPIRCSLNAAPSKPGYASRKIFFPNSTENTQPSGLLDYGTTIEFFCRRKFVLVDAITGNANPLVIQCGGTPKYKNSKWSGKDVSCQASSGLKIAIAASAASILIIILILGWFAADSCVKRERKAKAERRLVRDDDVFASEID